MSPCSSCVRALITAIFARAFSAMDSPLGACSVVSMTICDFLLMKVSLLSLFHTVLRMLPPSVQNPPALWNGFRLRCDELHCAAKRDVILLNHTPYAVCD